MGLELGFFIGKLSISLQGNILFDDDTFGFDGKLSLIAYTKKINNTKLYYAPWFGLINREKPSENKNINKYTTGARWGAEIFHKDISFFIETGIITVINEDDELSKNGVSTMITGGMRIYY